MTYVFDLQGRNHRFRRETSSPTVIPIESTPTRSGTSGLPRGLDRGCEGALRCSSKDTPFCGEGMIINDDGSWSDTLAHHR